MQMVVEDFIADFAHRCLYGLDLTDQIDAVCK